MKICVQKKAGVSFVEFLCVVIALVFLLAGLSLGVMGREKMAQQALLNATKADGIKEGLGHPTSITNLNSFSWITFLGRFQGNDGNVYVVALVGTNDAPTLFNTGTNEPPHDTKERSLLLYDGKRFISIPKAKSE